MKKIWVALFLAVMLSAGIVSAETKISELPAITTVDPANDVVPIVDVSGTAATKKATVDQLVKASLGSFISTGIVFCTTAGSVCTPSAITLGAAYSILQVDAAGTAAEFTSSLSISALDLTSATSSIPWPVGTATWPTAEGRAKWNSTSDALYIGDGATSIILDMTANATYTFPAATASLAPLTSPAFTTPNIGAATGTSLIVTGVIDGLATVEAANGKTIDKLSAYYVATGTNAFIVPTPSASGGNQYCVKQANAGTNAITVIPVHTSSVQLGKTDNSGYCDADDKLVSGGAATDQICVVALDATHYLTFSSVGTWTCTAH